jgi:hypothetical protein
LPNFSFRFLLLSPLCRFRLVVANLPRE